MLARVAATGGGTSDPLLQELASMTTAVLVAEARERHPAGDEQRLRQRAEEIAAPESAGLLLVRAPTWVPGLEVTVARGKNGEGGDTATPLKAPSLGLVGMRLEHREGALRIRVRRQADLMPARAATARLEVRAGGEEGEQGGAAAGGRGRDRGRLGWGSVPVGGGCMPDPGAEPTVQGRRANRR